MSSFKFYNLSGSPGKSCNVISFRDTLVMMDCTLDFISTLGFMPLSLIHNPQLSSLPNWKPDKETLKSANFSFRESRLVNYEIKECQNGLHCVDSAPEFALFDTGPIEVEKIDVVLISNYLNMFGLPYLTERLGFNGVIYVTEPTYHFGKIMMEEVIKLIERTPKPKRPNLWKRIHEHVNLAIPRNHVVNRDPNKWQTIFTSKELNACLSKLKVVNFSQSIDIFGLFEISAHSSGFCIGSCNWVLKSCHEKIVFMSHTSLLTTHPKPFESQPLQDADVMLLTNLTQSPLVNPDQMLGDFCSTTIQTLKNDGNVLVPCYPCGMVYDLIECIAGQLTAANLTMVPIYFISPVAKSSLAYSNILGEWLTSSKSSKVFLPDEPFMHSTLVRAGRLKFFSSVSDSAFNETFKCPCVVFTSHPSLRFGDVIHFIQLWGQASKNLLVLTEPDFHCAEVLNPYLPLAMKVAYLPIDTNWNFKQANNLLSNELRPGHLILHNNYVAKPPANFYTTHGQYSTTDIMIELRNVTDDDQALEPVQAGQSDNQNQLALMRHGATKSTLIHPYTSQEPMELPNVKTAFERVKIDSLSASQIVQSEIRPGVCFATVNGSILARDNKYSLLLPDNNARQLAIQRGVKLPPSHYFYGNLDLNLLMALLQQSGITDATIEGSRTSKIIDLKSIQSAIHVEEFQTHIITNDQNFRVRLRELITACLRRF